MIFKLFLSFCDDLVESLESCITDAFQVLCLLHTQDGQGVLGQGCQDSLVAERLIAHSFEVGVFFELDELVCVILVEWVE